MKVLFLLERCDHYVILCDLSCQPQLHTSKVTAHKSPTVRSDNTRTEGAVSWNLLEVGIAARHSRSLRTQLPIARMDSVLWSQMLLENCGGHLPALLSFLPPEIDPNHLMISRVITEHLA